MTVGNVDVFHRYGITKRKRELSELVVRQVENEKLREGGELCR